MLPIIHLSVAFALSNSSIPVAEEIVAALLFFPWFWYYANNNNENSLTLKRPLTTWLELNLTNMTTVPMRFCKYHCGKKYRNIGKTPYPGNNIDAAIYRYGPTYDSCVCNNDLQPKSVTFPEERED